MSVGLLIKAQIDLDALELVINKVGNMRSALELAKNETVTTIKENIKSQGVYDTGFLYNSIDGEVSDTGFSVYDGAPYGIYNELGTWKMAARPFFIPSIERMGEIIAVSIRNHLE